MSRGVPADAILALGVAAALFLIYNDNGREIRSDDSQPNKFAAREPLLRHTLALNHVVGAAPPLAERSAFVVDTRGRYRSAYPPVPAGLAAAIAWPFWKSGVLDIRAPLAPNVIAVVAASLLTSIAVAPAYLTARARVPRRRALLIATGLGVGTGLWSEVSQTLWVHETAILGVAVAALARYFLDVLFCAVSLAAAAVAARRIARAWTAVAAGARVWSIFVEGTDAFFYPNDQWNTDPEDVDRHHARLWTWSDNQIVRCSKRGPSPQNFTLSDRARFRQPPR